LLVLLMQLWVLVENLLDELGVGGADLLVDVQGLPQGGVATGGVVGLDMAVADACECVCFFEGGADVTGDGERFGVAGEPVFWAECDGLQGSQVVEVFGFGGTVTDLAMQGKCLGEGGGGGLVVAGEVLQRPSSRKASASH
jgi:hypothetical protein